MNKVILSIIILFFPIMATADEIGICGANLSYNYKESAHTLTISGKGPMLDGLYEMPWNSFVREINVVVIKEGVTTIGYNAFSVASI